MLSAYMRILSFVGNSWCFGPAFPQKLGWNVCGVLIKPQTLLPWGGTPSADTGY